MRASCLVRGWGGAVVVVLAAGAEEASTSMASASSSITLVPGTGGQVGPWGGDSGSAMLLVGVSDWVEVVVVEAAEDDDEKEEMVAAAAAAASCSAARRISLCESRDDPVRPSQLKWRP